MQILKTVVAWLRGLAFGRPRGFAVGVNHWHGDLKRDLPYLEKLLEETKGRFPGKQIVVAIEAPREDAELKRLIEKSESAKDTMEYWRGLEERLQGLGAKVVRADSPAAVRYLLKAKTRVGPPDVHFSKLLDAVVYAPAYVKHSLRNRTLAKRFNKFGAHVLVTGAHHTKPLAEELGLEKRYADSVVEFEDENWEKSAQEEVMRDLAEANKRREAAKKLRNQRFLERTAKKTGK